MHQMVTSYFCYIMFMTVYIGIYEELGYLFVDTLGKRCNLKLLWYSYWSMSISISQLKDHSIAFGQARYSSSVVAKYLETVTINKFKVS